MCYVCVCYTCVYCHKQIKCVSQDVLPEAHTIVVHLWKSASSEQGMIMGKQVQSQPAQEQLHQ